MEDNNEYTFTDENGNEIKVEKEKKQSKFNIGKDGIHIKDGDTTVDIGKDGIHVNDGDPTVNVGKDGVHVNVGEKDRINVDIGKDGVHVNGKEYNYREEIKKHNAVTFPFFALATLVYVALVLLSSLKILDFGDRNVFLWGLLIFLIVPIAQTLYDCISKRRYSSGAAFMLCLAAFLAVGFIFDAWHPGWMLLLISPLLDSIIKAVRNKNAADFAFWDLCLLIFLSLGFAPAFGIADEPLWHPGWVIFLLIPVYYTFVSYAKKKLR